MDDSSAAANGGEVVVVTGACGCLGLQTVKLLINKDDRVSEIRCLDLIELESCKLEEIESEQAKFEQSSGLRKQIKFIKGDIRDINTVEKTLSGSHCVIHCAAKIAIWQENREQDALDLDSTNIQGTETLLKAATRLSVQKFIHVSSFESFTSYHTIYYATENTLPDASNLLFGRSGTSKKEAERLVKQYSRNKLDNVSSLNGKDLLNAIIVRFGLMYGEHDKYYITKLLKIANFFGGKLQRFSNVWIRQQPIYVGNAAWALIKAKQRMDSDDSISGEDDSTIGDPFEFLEPYLEALDMKVTKRSYPAIPIYFLIRLFFAIRRLIDSIDVFDWFSDKKKKTRLQAAIEEDERRTKACNISNDLIERSDEQKPKKWYDLIKPQIFFFLCNSLFLNRTKASLRLKYEPLFDPEESRNRSINWYKNNLKF